MFRFTIRDVLWLMVVVGMGCGWWAEHRWVTKRTLHQQFTFQADRWEGWCNEIRFSSVTDRRDHASFRKLVAMGDNIIPFIFERWPPRRGDGDKWPSQPPWWYLLEDLTGKIFADDEDKRPFTPEEFIEYLKDKNPVSDEERKWRDWWNSESKGERNVEQPRSIVVGREI